jgi:cytochrome c biogenesis factor
LVIVLLLVNGLSLLLKWRQTNGGEVIKKSITAFTISIVFSVLALAFGVRDWGMLAIVFCAFFALVVNIEIGWKVLSGHWQIAYDKSAPTRKDYFRRLWTAFGISTGLALIGLLVSTAGDYNLFLPAIQTGWPYATILFAALLIYFVTAGYPKITLDTKFLGAYVAHMGLAIFVVGVVLANGYTKKEIVRMPLNQTQSAFGGKYKLTWVGNREGEKDHIYWLISIADKNGKFLGVGQPLVFWTDFNQRTEPIRNPGIVKYAARDLYFTVLTSEEVGGVPRDTLGKMQSVALFHDSLKITFLNFDFPQSERAKMISQQPFHVKAFVVANSDTLTLGVTRNPATNEAKEDDIVVPGTSYHVQLDQLMPNMQDPSKSRVVLRAFDVNAPPPPRSEVITVETFVKPYINLVWAGILTLVVGFGFAVMRRRREARVAIERAERAYEKLLGQKHEMLPDAAAQSASRVLHAKATV